ncbi:MAG TPA: hypothetical protein VK200_05525 [Candidatus Limnocylindrales bacterium]|nr:hypothetical protein [Candidatus Limnocylindrales bacterium]
MDLDPIKQLQSLLEDRGKVLEKISSIHSALGSLRTDSAEPQPESPPAIAVQPQMTANPFSDDRAYSRLLQALRDMEAQIEERVRPLAKQVVEFEVARLRKQSGHDQESLNSCLEQIDQCIVNCVKQFGEYQKKHALLISLNQRIANLGATPQPLSDFISIENLDAAIQSRVEGLRNQGKLGDGVAAVNAAK